MKLILGLHNPQPGGNFDGVFEEAYRTAYLPFLDVLEGYPEIPFVVHTSGPLLEWLGGGGARGRGSAEAGVRGGRGGEPGRRVLRADPHHDPASRPRGADPGLFAVPGGDARGAGA